LLDTSFFFKTPPQSADFGLSEPQIRAGFRDFAESAAPLPDFKTARLPDADRSPLEAADLAVSAPRRYPQNSKKILFLEWKFLKKAH